MKNKIDAAKKAGAEKHDGGAGLKQAPKSGKGRNSEFKPFWETEPAKTEKQSSARKTDHSRPAAAKPAPKNEASRVAKPKATAGPARSAGTDARQGLRPGQPAAERKPASRPERTKGEDQQPNLHSGQTLELQIVATTNEVPVSGRCAGREAGAGRRRASG